MKAAAPDGEKGGGENAVFLLEADVECIILKKIF
jgi:hypothetical protein